MKKRAVTQSPQRGYESGKRDAPTISGEKQSNWAKEVKSIDPVFSIYREMQLFQDCQEQNSLIIHGIDSTGSKLLRCKVCRKSVSGQSLLDLMEGHLGKSCKTKSNNDLEENKQNGDHVNSKSDGTQGGRGQPRAKISAQKSKQVSEQGILEKLQSSKKDVTEETHKLKLEIKNVSAKMDRLESTMGHMTAQNRKHIPTEERNTNRSVLAATTILGDKFLNQLSEAAEPGTKNLS